MHSFFLSLIRISWMKQSCFSNLSGVVDRAVSSDYQLELYKDCDLLKLSHIGNASNTKVD